MRPVRRAEACPAVGRRRAWWWPLVALAAAASTALVLATTGGFTATVADAGDRLATGSLLTAAASGGVTECDLTAGSAAITSANTARCSGQLLPPESLPATGTTSSATTVTDRGSLPAAATSLTSAVCGPVQLADSVTPGDPLLVRGNVPGYAKSGPPALSGSLGVAFDGTTNYAADVTAVPSSATTTAFSVAIWFKTTSSGSLIGLVDTPSVASPRLYDKMLYVDTAGHVVMATYNGALTELTSPGTYTDGAWHLAVGTFAAATGMALYVDGAAPVTAGAGNDFGYSGYWHIGWEDYSPYWPDAPAFNYFSGTLSDAATFTTALTAAQIAALRTAGTQAAWAAGVQADGATGSWALADSGTVAYTGPVPGVAPSPCSFVDATVATTTTTSTACAAPAAPGACPAPSSSLTLASLASKVTTLPGGLTPGRPLTLTVTLSRDASTTVSANPNAAGLDLTMATAVGAADGGFTATLSWPGAGVVL